MVNEKQPKLEWDDNDDELSKEPIKKTKAIEIAQLAIGNIPIQASRSITSLSTPLEQHEPEGRTELRPRVKRNRWDTFNDLEFAALEEVLRLYVNTRKRSKKRQGSEHKIWITAKKLHDDMPKRESLEP